MATKSNTIFLGKGGGPVEMPLRYANRHGLIAGATGTGKTKTLQLLAGQLSKAGVPVFVADIKGDLAGIAADAARLHIIVSAVGRVTFRDALEAQLAGFRNLVRTGIRLRVAQRVRLNLTMELEGQEEDITVLANVSLVQSEPTAVSGAVLEHPRVVELPLNGRDFFQLIALVPGVAAASEGAVRSSCGRQPSGREIGPPPLALMEE